MIFCTICGSQWHSHSVCPKRSGGERLAQYLFGPDPKKEEATMKITKVPQEGAVYVAPGDYTLEHLEADMIEIIVNNPDNVNPSTPAQCIYYKEEDDGTVSRCLIGTWLHERGHEYDPLWDPPNGKGAGGIATDLGYSASVRRRLDELQKEADGVVGPPVAWRTILRLAPSRGE